MYNRPEAKTKQYKRWVYLVIVRCKGKCIACGARTKCAHHIESFDWAYSLRYDPKNGVLLCTGKKGKYGVGCHNHFHKLYGYGNNTRYQLKNYLALYHNKNLDDYN